MVKPDTPNLTGIEMINLVTLRKCGVGRSFVEASVSSAASAHPSRRQMLLAHLVLKQKAPGVFV